MQKLGDLFPNALKKQLIEVGAVLKIHIEVVTPPKVKRFIVVGFNEEKVLLAAVLINTEINPNVFPEVSYKRTLHIELEAEDRPYLVHTSYVNCSQIIEHPVSDIEQFVVEDPSIHIGTVSTLDLEQIITTLKGAKSIKPKIKKRYGFI